MKKLHIDIWSDIACPWCYVGKRHLEEALAQFPHRDDVEVVWRAFELDPSAPPATVATSARYAERLAKKYGFSIEAAQQRLDQMVKTAAVDGLDFRFDRIRPGNMFDAHRVLHLAHDRGDRGDQDAVKERFLHAYMTDGDAMSDHETLVRLAAEAGLDPDEVRTTLASDAYASNVREDEREAAELGINGVPFFVIGGRYAISGAQPAATLLRALNLAWTDLAPKPIELAAGEVCGPDGCVVPER